MLEGKHGKHVALVGSTGCGKTTLAKYIVSLTPHPVTIIDWDGEYVDLGLPVLEPPFPLPAVDVATLVSNLERPPDGGHGVAFAVFMASFMASSNTIDSVTRELERMAFSSNGLLASWAQSALVRLLALEKYFVFFANTEHSPGVYDISCVPERERSIVQQALATAIVLSRSVSSDPLLLVIEEGGMGATTHFLKDLLVLSRRRGVQLVWISHQLPPEELLADFTLVIGDPGPLRDRWSRTLGVPLPRLGWGEFVVFDGNVIKKLRVKL